LLRWLFLLDLLLDSLAGFTPDSLTLFSCWIRSLDQLTAPLAGFAQNSFPGFYYQIRLQNLHRILSLYSLVVFDSLADSFVDSS